MDINFCIPMPFLIRFNICTIPAKENFLKSYKQRGIKYGSNRIKDRIDLMFDVNYYDFDIKNSIILQNILFLETRYTMFSIKRPVLFHVLV